MRRADLFLALGDEHQVDRQLAVGPAEGVQRREEWLRKQAAARVVP